MKRLMTELAEAGRDDVWRAAPGNCISWRGVVGVWYGGEAAWRKPVSKPALL
jgi:hypothetical protein